MNGQVEKKQRYLRENILDCNYDPQQFADFCEKVIGNVQIQVWTFTSLESTVKMFIDSKTNQNRLESIEGSSFMNYQQELNEIEEVDIDSIDVTRNWMDQSEQRGQQLTNYNNQVQNISSNVCVDVVREHRILNQQSSIWGPESEAMVGLENFEVDLSKGIFQGGSSNVPNSSDKFGDFSIPSGYGMDPVQSNVEHIAESLCEEVHLPSHQDTKHNYKYPVSQCNFRKIGMLGTRDNSCNSRLTTKNSMPLSNKPAIQAPQSLSSVQPYTVPALVKKHSVQDTTSKSNLKSEPGFLKESFSDVVFCVKANVRTLLNDSKLSVEVTGHEVVNRGFLLPSYVHYSISVKPMNFEVKRKYTYFLKLRILLGKFYPGIRLPYLDKGAWISETNSDFIKLQKLGIQGFMNDILMNPEFRNCRMVEEFLTIKGPSELKARFTEYEKITKIRKIEQMCLLKGCVNVSYTKEHRHYFEKLPILLQSLDSSFGKYRALNQKLNGIYNSLINTYTDIEQVFVTIQESLRAFKSTVNHTSPSLQFGIQALNDHYRQLNTNIRLESKLLEREFKSLWSYQINNLGTIRDLLDIRVKMTETYTKSHSENLYKKQFNMGSKKLQQIKHGLDQPSKDSMVLKYQTAFYNETSLAQTSRMFEDLGRKILKIISVGTVQYQDRVRDSLDFYRTQKKAVRNMTLSNY